MSSRHLHRALVLAAVLIPLVLVSPRPASAQAVKGTLLGTITDAQGAGVPGATVTVTETGTNIARTAQSNASGNYIFSNLKDGTYRVGVEMPGFRKTDGLAFDVVPLPTKKSAISVLHSDGYCVTKAAKNKDLAQAFAAYAVTGPGANLLARSGRTVPVSKAIAQSPDFLAPDKAPKNSRVFIDQVEDARLLPHSPTWNEAEGAVGEVLVQLFAGKTSLDRAIADIIKATRVELSK